MENGWMDGNHDANEIQSKVKNMTIAFCNWDFLGKFMGSTLTLHVLLEISPEYASIEACELLDPKSSLHQSLGRRFAKIASCGRKSQLFSNSQSRALDSSSVEHISRWRSRSTSSAWKGSPQCQKGLAGIIDAAAAASGGLVVTANDMYFWS